MVAGLYPGNCIPERKVGANDRHSPLRFTLLNIPFDAYPCERSLAKNPVMPALATFSLICSTSVV